MDFFMGGADSKREAGWFFPHKSISACPDSEFPEISLYRYNCPFSLVREKPARCLPL